MSFFNELKRRNVIRVAIAYIVMAWLVMQVADVILNNIEAPSWVFQTILLLLGIGFLVAMFFSWAFEMTPDGLKREHEVDRTQSITPQTGKKLNNLIFAVMGLALAYFAYDKFVLTAGRDAALVEATTQTVSEQAATKEASGESNKSIAVLPFADMSPDKDQEYFSDGLSEELLNLLAKIPELRVIARTSSFAYKGTDKKIEDVAQELNVGHVLEGSVRKSGNQVRITAQLIRASDSSHLWSETYDRSLENIFAIQDEISGAVVTQLKVTLLGAVEKSEEIDPNAYALFLRARHLSHLSTMESWEQSNDLYLQALESAPNYAAGWCGLAENYSVQTSNGLRPFEEGFALAREMANKALEFDPDFAPAHAVLGGIAISHDQDLNAAARHFGRALELEPANADIITKAGYLTQSLGRLEQLLAMDEYVVSLDPVNARGHRALGYSYRVNNRLDASIASYQTAQSLSPGMLGSYYQISLAHLFKGEPEAALDALMREPSELWRIIGLPMVYYALGELEKSDTALVELIDRLEKEAAANIAEVLAFRGEPDRAFVWLDKAIQYHDPGVSDAPTNNLYRNLHDDPRWQPFLERIGMSPEQLAAIEFNVTLPE